ncbi:probable serine/threonine-protein kinase kinX isoform X3 [Acanthopagrus latus]|uniref:probable serine/threonine-protein kinase kinX isoform X3 n=1 Tax=Acanthopagrus latus TaxID=8177 RepID=UPI00187D0B31|nr:probable serine/threonine-protein kinase kinX isoform X3 [Acanthopagrus latus]
MAQSDSSPNLDLSNGAVVHSPLSICSDLDTERGRQDEEGEEEDEEVELAEEVGEDVLMMAGAEEDEVKGERGEQSEREEMRIIQVALLLNGVTAEEGEDEGCERLEENGEAGVEVGDEEHERTDEETTENVGESKAEEESKDTNTVTENPCHISAMIDVEKGQEQMTDGCEENEEDREDEEHEEEAVIASSETEFRQDDTNERNNGLEEDPVVSSPDDPEHVQDSSTLTEVSEERKQLSTDDTDKQTKAVSLPSDGDETESVEDPTTDADIITIEVNKLVNNQDHVCQTSTPGDTDTHFETIGTIEVLANQTNQTPSENEDENTDADVKDNSEPSKQEIDSINNNSTWEQEDYVEAEAEEEGTEELVKDSVSASVDDLETNQKVQQPDLTFIPSEEQSQTEGGIEGARVSGINQEVLDEEQVRQVWANTLTEMDGGGQSTEEEVKTAGNVVRESLREEEHRGGDDLEMQEEKTVQIENQGEGQADLPEPVPQCVEDAPVETQQDVDLDQVEEAFELEEGGEIQSEKPEAEVRAEKENESKTEDGGDLQELPLPLIKEARTDWEEKIREQLRQQALVEDEKGGGADEEAMEGELEMAEEPVTVLDDEIEEIEASPCTELDEQAPVAIITPSEDTIVEAKDGEDQEMQEEKVEVGKEDNEKQKVERIVEVEKDERPKDENREVELDINGKVKGLKQAMENGLLSLEPQPIKKEELATARVLSPRRRDNDWIKKDQPEEETEPELKEWRKELRPVRKESERGRKEWVKKETSPEEKSLPRKEDWIKELKSVIKDDSLPKKRDVQVKKKRVVLLEDGRSYFPQREEINEKREEVKLISHRRVESPLPPMNRNNASPQDQDYKISLYVKELASEQQSLNNSTMLLLLQPVTCRVNLYILTL